MLRNRLKVHSGTELAGLKQLVSSRSCCFTGVCVSAGGLSVPLGRANVYAMAPGFSTGGGTRVDAVRTLALQLCVEDCQD